MSTQTYPQFKAYFYNGFKKPVLLAESLESLMNDVHVESNYLGDQTDMVRSIGEEFKQHRDIESLKDELAMYDIMINPTLEELQEKNRSYCLDDDTYLDDFLN